MPLVNSVQLQRLVLARPNTLDNVRPAVGAPNQIVGLEQGCDLEGHQRPQIRASPEHANRFRVRAIHDFSISNRAPLRQSQGMKKVDFQMPALSVLASFS